MKRMERELIGALFSVIIGKHFYVMLNMLYFCYITSYVSVIPYLLLHKNYKSCIKNIILWCYSFSVQKLWLLPV